MATFKMAALFQPLFHHQLKGVQYYRTSSEFPKSAYGGGSDDPVGDKIGQPSLHPSSELLRFGKNAMVASDVPICSSMGKQILLRGGNAADAAVTVALCIGSINLHSSGIGGGGFIVSSKKNDVISIDAREMAPGTAHKHMYDGMPLLAQFGGLAVAVPGELAGLYELYSRHGSGNLSWHQLFDPVISLNRNGWSSPEIWTRAVHKNHDSLLSRVPKLNDNWDFIYKEGKLVEMGDWVTRPNYADTLEKIARNGSCAIFYDPHGPIAPKLAKLAQLLGGSLTPDDFGQYTAKVTKALLFNFTVDGDHYELSTTGGVSSGLALIAGLNFYSAVQTNDSESDVLKTHRMIEAMKWTASARSHLGDVNETYFGELVERFSSPEWARDTTEKKYSDKKTFPWQHYEPQYGLTEPHGTLHFSVVDEHGGAVGMTTTVNLLFGSLVYDNETGIILNDEMDDFLMPGVSNAFNLTPSVFNFIRPYTRPLSLTTPTIIKKNGELDFLIGAAGGSRIVTAVLQAIVRNIYEKLPLLETIAYPRLHHQLIPEYTWVENLDMFDKEYDDCMKCKLEELHHDFLETGSLTAMNGIKKSDSGWLGVSDYWRKRGLADGY